MCSNPLFGRIHETYVRTQLANMHCGVTSDCPHRERLGYTGDGQVAAQSAIYALDMARFYSKWTDDIDDARNHKSGYVPHTAPFEGGGGGPPWGSAMVLMPWYLYLYYADRQALDRHYGAMKDWVRYLGTRTDSDGVVAKEEPEGWFLGDWCAPAKIEIPPELVSTCYYAYCARIVAQAAQILGRDEDVAALNGIARASGDAMHKRFFDVQRRQYGNGKQGASFYPLAFGLVPPEHQTGVFARAVEIIEKDNREHFDTGFVGTPLVLDVLTSGGRVDLAYRLMNQTDFPSFGHMLQEGATTLWEDWERARVARASDVRRGLPLVLAGAGWHPSGPAAAGFRAHHRPSLRCGGLALGACRVSRPTRNSGRQLASRRQYIPHGSDRSAEQ